VLAKVAARVGCVTEGTLPSAPLRVAELQLGAGEDEAKDGGAQDGRHGPALQRMADWALYPPEPDGSRCAAASARRLMLGSSLAIRNSSSASRGSWGRPSVKSLSALVMRSRNWNTRLL
jgi:hypothetical protein